MWTFAYLAIVHLLGLLIFLLCSEDAKEIELLALRQEVAVLRRQIGRPAYEAADRAILAASSRYFPRSRWSSFGVGPATLHGWHRRLVVLPIEYDLDPSRGAWPRRVVRLRWCPAFRGSQGRVRYT